MRLLQIAIFLLLVLTWHGAAALQSPPCFSAGSVRSSRHVNVNANEKYQLRMFVDDVGNDNIDATHAIDTKRRISFVNLVTLLVGTPQLAQAAASRDTAILNSPIGERIQVPLKFIPELQAYVVFYSVGGDRFGAILDTGSPFLMVPSYCDETKWGCYRPGSSVPSGLDPTVEQFDNSEGEVEWRRAPFSFVNATGSMSGPAQLTFGVLSESLMNGPGGVFFGLVRDTDKRIRPSFLGQTQVKAFEVDLSSAVKTVTLSTSALLPSDDDYIPLVKDLNRKYGDPTVHYTAFAKSVQVNGSPLLLTADGRRRDGKSIYVIFDTGVTGMVVSQGLFDERYSSARKNRERSLWGTVDILFQTKNGKEVTISAKKPFTTPIRDIPWKGFNAHLIVVGLSFLDGHSMTVDIDEQKLSIGPSTTSSGGSRSI